MLLLWAVIAGISGLYVFHALHERESAIRHVFNLSADRAQRYIQRTTDVMKELKSVAINRPVSDDIPSQITAPPFTVAEFTPLATQADCDVMATRWHDPLQSLSWFLRYWRENFSAIYDLNRLFLLDGDNRCMASFDLHNIPLDRTWTLNGLYQRVEHYRNTPRNQRPSHLFWITPEVSPGVSYFYALTPVYSDNHLQAMSGIEQTLRSENFFMPAGLPINVTILDENNQPLLALSGSGKPLVISEPRWRHQRAWFGYTHDFRQLVLKKSLAPTPFSVVYALPIKQVIGHLRILIINVILGNIFSAVLLFLFARWYERRIFSPAEHEAWRLAEHEQFNRKIVASAPVGISILRIPDGSNILSNELAHNYLRMLTYEDRQRLTQIISGQQINFVDVLTSNNTNLQISFVHSRYGNENVAICVLVDVSARVKMEQSLQEVAQAAEQASQTKSMFLATVSHELRTPLYGIIGNLDLLQTKALPQEVNRLVMAMNNSSGLLLEIISDILDFSKMESEQLKIERREFSPREVVNHVAANYLPLVVGKQLALYCFVEPDVPQGMTGDPLRLQQVISNLLSNAIKFTDTGCIVLHLQCAGEYLQISVRDTGIGIAAKEVVQLFEPFVQAGDRGQQHFQGTGLGLAICEKLISMMDGDIAVDSAPGIGSRFTLRLPLYGVKNSAPVVIADLADKCYWLAIRNTLLAQFVTTLLHYYGLPTRIYDGQYPPAKEDILLLDEEPQVPWPGKAIVIFSRNHMGMAQQRAPGEWLYSLATAYELLSLLKLICQPDSMASAGKHLSAIPETVVTHNSDKTILVVDDHPINRRLLSDQLSSLGYHCITANDGIDALNVLEKQHIDIVLSDVNMPNMDGYQLAQSIRQRGMKIPVIGVTANAMAEEKQRCLAAGMDSCLAKPVTLDIIRPLLAQYATCADNDKT